MPRYSKFGTKKEVVLAFFLGAAVSSIAFDFASYFFYSTSTKALPLTAFEQLLVYAFFPFVYYMAFFLAGYLLFKFTHVKAVFILYFYALTVAIAVGLGFSLPQQSSQTFTVTVLLGSFVAGGVIYGMVRQTGR